MPDNLGILLRSMAGSLRQSNLPICQLVATALDGSVGQINTKTIKKSEIAPVKLDGIDPPPDPTLMDLFQAIFFNIFAHARRRGLKISIQGSFLMLNQKIKKNFI